MSKQGQVLFITPFFLLLAALSCVLFSKLNREHESLLLKEKNYLEQVSLKQLEEPFKDAVRETVNMLANSSSFRLAWSSKFAQNIHSISEEKVGGFELLAFLISDEEICETLLLINSQNRQYRQLLNLLKESLIREYESLCFFDRARRFARHLNLEEELVMKVLKEGIESFKYEKDPASIIAMIDFLKAQREPICPTSFTLL